MAKRLVGIEITASAMRIVIAEPARDGMVVRSFAQRPAATAEERIHALGELLEKNASSHDRIATCLPASSGYSRVLSFPFHDAKKLAAVLRFELGAQLPLDIADFVLASSKPRHHENQYMVRATAVAPEKVSRCLHLFEEARLVLQTLEMAPGPYGAGLPEKGQEALLVSLNEDEAGLSHWRSGLLESSIFFPGVMAMPQDEAFSLLLRETGNLCRNLTSPETPVLLMGSGVQSAWMERFSDALGRPCRIPEVLCEGTPLPAAFLPAASLAGRAAMGSREGLNLRTGAFALKSQWTGLRSYLVAAGTLLVLAAAVSGADAFLRFDQKSRQAEELQSRIDEEFRKTFPGISTIVNAPAQMQAKLNETRNKARALGLLGQASALSVLREISAATPEDIRVDIRNYLYDTGSVRLEGVTGSFEAVNRLVAGLGASGLISEVQITDAKMSVDGKQVNFRLTLNLADRQEQP